MNEGKMQDSFSSASDGEWVLSFDSTHAAMAAQVALSDLDTFVIPTPHEVTASCGISIRMDSSVVEQAKELLSSHPDIVNLSSWHELSGGAHSQGSAKPPKEQEGLFQQAPRLTGDDFPSDPVIQQSVVLLNYEGVAEEVQTTVQVEHSLDVYVNEELTMRVVCTPAHLFDLVIGRLFTEGLISGIEEIESIDLLANGTRANVYLRNREADLSRTHVDVVPTCCTGNQVFNSYFVDDPTLKKLDPIEWKPEWIFSLARTFAEDSPLHRKTFGAHSCYLSLGGGLVCCREDLGRHNALDKAVGHALREGINLGDCILYSSGRIPVDMVQKAIRARIPVLASKAVPTDMTIRLAQEFGLSLICSARPDSMRILSDFRPQASTGQR